MIFTLALLRHLLIGVLAVVPFNVLFPARLDGPNRLERLSNYGSAGREILRIYSFIKFKRSDLSEKHTWDIAKTIARESRSHSIDPMLVVAVIEVESRFRLEAVSQDGARGLMQIRPEAAAEITQNARAELKREGTFTPEFLHDPTINIKIGVSYLSYLQKKFRDLRLALIAYNWGPTKIQKRLDEYEEIPEDYAIKVLSTYHSYREKKVPSHKPPWKST